MVVIAKEIFELNLSIGALGLLVFSVSHPKNTEFDIRSIIGNRDESRLKIRSYIEELILNFYCVEITYMTGKVVFEFFQETDECYYRAQVLEQLQGIFSVRTGE